MQIWLNKYRKCVSLQLFHCFQRKQVEAETSGTSALALPLAILIGLLSYYHVAVSWSLS